MLCLQEQRAPITPRSKDRIAGSVPTPVPTNGTLPSGAPSTRHFCPAPTGRAPSPSWTLRRTPPRLPKQESGHLARGWHSRCSEIKGPGLCSCLQQDAQTWGPNEGHGASQRARMPKHTARQSLGFLTNRMTTCFCITYTPACLQYKIMQEKILLQVEVWNWQVTELLCSPLLPHSEAPWRRA